MEGMKNNSSEESKKKQWREIKNKMEQQGGNLSGVCVS
jgi:hypothetical protein